MFKLIGKLIKWSIYIGVGSALLLFVLIDTPVETVSQEEITKEKLLVEKEAEEEVRKGFHCLSDWNGSHSAVVKFTKEQLRDPKSFEHDKTLVWPVSSDGTHQLVMQYRAKNGFGGMTAGVVKAFYSNSDCKATIKSID